MADIFDLTDIWNDAGTTFTAIGMDVTDTASQAGSMLIDLQVGGVSRFAVRKDGVVTSPLARLPESIAAAGSNQAGATAITADLFIVTSGSGGIRLPAATVGRKIKGVCLSASGVPLVYPAIGETINNQAANGPVRLRVGSVANFICLVAGSWRTEMSVGIEASMFSVAAGNGRMDMFDPDGRTIFFSNVGAMAIQGQAQCYNSQAGGGLAFLGAANAHAARFQIVSAPDIAIQPFNATGNNWYTAMRWSSVNAQVNYFDVVGGAAGNGIVMSAAGTDPNIDMRFAPKGSGLMSFGSHSAIAAETVTGYITIKDAGGTVRKLAVVS